MKTQDDKQHSTPLRALIVEDDEMQRELLKTFLEHLGHETVCAENGGDALLLFESEPPDYVLMDILLPGMDGFEATARMQSIAGDDWVPVIYITGMKQRASLIAGLEAGGHDYIVKPVDLDILEAKLHALVRAIENHIRLRSTEALLDMVFEPCKDAALGFTGDGIVIAANEGAERLLGRDRAALRGRHMADLFGPGQNVPQTPQEWARLADGAARPVAMRGAKGNRIDSSMQLYSRPFRSRRTFLAMFDAAA
jgi:DNA-binding response OmpR family regulator